MKPNAMKLKSLCRLFACAFLLTISFSQTFAQRQLMSVHRSGNDFAANDIYCASLINQWNGSFEIVIPDYQSVEKIWVEAYYSTNAEAKNLPTEKVTFIARDEEIEVILPKKEKYATTNQNYFVYRTILNQLTPSVVMRSEFQNGPVMYRIIAKRNYEHKSDLLEASTLTIK